MKLRTERNGSELVVRLSGRLDAETAPAIRQELESANLSETNQMILDFSGVQYISSAGLSLTLAMAKLLKQAGGSLVLTGLKGQIKQVIELSGLTRTVQVREGQSSGGARTIRLPASLESIREGRSFVNDCAAKEGMPKERFSDLELILEEILVNVVVHAYKGEGGEVEVSCFPAGDMLCLQFVDTGPEFNPLLAPKPDLDLSVEERPIGGLGIHLVRQLAADVKYARENGANKLQVYVRK